jgi:hypothetical protein
LKNNHRPMGELLDEGFLNRARLDWAAERAYEPIKQAAQVILESQKRPSVSINDSEKIKPVQQQEVALPIGIALEKARATLWPLPPYKGQPMGDLVKSQQLSLKDLGYAIENAWDEKVRQAATALALVRLEQVVKEPVPSAGFVHVISGGRSYSQRRQYQLALIEGFIFGVFIVFGLVVLILSLINSFSPHPGAKSLTEVVSTPIGVIVLVVAGFVALFLGWLLNFLTDQITKSIDKKIEEHRRGEEGEDKTVQLIVQALDGTWRLFRNVLIPGRNKGDLDLVLVGPPGVWSLEVKNWRGEYRNIGESWEYRRGKKWKAASGNPSRQATDNAARLGNFLKADTLKVFVNPAIVWANEENPVKVENPSAAVWSLNRLPDELGNIWQGEKLSQVEREKIIEKLTKLCVQQKTE